MLTDEKNPFWGYHSLRAKYATDDPMEHEPTTEQAENSSLLLSRIQTLLCEQREKGNLSETSEE